LTHDRPVRGLATSGWGGRSFSLGIADSVTVLARCAAAADAAATVVANAVDAEHPAIERRRRAISIPTAISASFRSRLGSAPCRRDRGEASTAALQWRGSPAA
jgi:ApbE superfamily uncharacterized protein (UPF0280 family)